jgi:flagella basal body P-ring formation protein FlgA
MTPVRSLFFLALGLGLLSTAPVCAAETASQLTGKTMITAGIVTVGDLFTNTGGASDHVLAPAPAVGEVLNLSSIDLLRVAKAFHLNWQPKDNIGVTLERDALNVDNKKIIGILNDSELKSRLAAGAEFQLTNIHDPIVIPGHQALDFAISDTNFDEQNKLFSAVLNISRDHKILRQISLEGTASVMINVPVLKFAMPYDTVITENDVTEITMPEAQLRGDAIARKSDLIGMTAKRTLAPNEIITQQDVNPPVLVKRNDLVTITYKSGPIQLSSKARSLGNGSIGDSLQFLNTSSKKTFEAKVTGPQQAEVNIDG